MNRIIWDDAILSSFNIDFDWFKNKKILVTGASGLVGVNLITVLSQTLLPYVCDLVINSFPEGWFAYLLADDKRFNICQLDLTNEYSNQELFSMENEYDCIIHLATYGQPNLIFSRLQMSNQLKTIELNTSITMKLFNLLKRDGKFLFMSTSELYNGLEGAHEEYQIGTTNTVHQRACYIEAKRCGEAICNVYRNIGYDVKVIRLCLAYGGGIKKTDKRVLNTFISEGLLNGEINLMDSGDAIRTYCYSVDVVEMLLNILLDGKDFIYNVGGIEKITIKQLADKIGHILNVPVKVPLIDNKIKGATNQVELNINKYLNEFGVKSFISMNDGIVRTIQWWKYILNI